MLGADSAGLPSPRAETPHGSGSWGVFLREGWSWREVRGRVSCVLRDGAGVDEQLWQSVRPGRWGHKDLGDGVCHEQGSTRIQSRQSQVGLDPLGTPAPGVGGELCSPNLPRVC